MVVLVVGWVSIGGQVVLVAVETVFACLAALGTAIREREREFAGSEENLGRWGGESEGDVGWKG
jgi:hypothetical protein